MAKTKIMVHQVPGANSQEWICDHVPHTSDRDGPVVLCGECFDLFDAGGVVIDKDTGKVVMGTMCDGARYVVGASTFRRVNLSPIEQTNWTKVESVCERVLTVIRGIPEENRADWVQKDNVLLCGDCAKVEEPESEHGKFLERERQRNAVK
jgi:hypothetical protein